MMSAMERASRELDRMRTGGDMSQLEREALEYLNDLIDAGREYPDAEWLAWCQYKAISHERLQELYDSQP
jgi:hypothetical protein